MLSIVKGGKPCVEGESVRLGAGGDRPLPDFKAARAQGHRDDTALRASLSRQFAERCRGTG